MNDQEQIKCIDSLIDVQQLTVGNYHSIAVTNKGIWVWGKADKCNLGKYFSQQSILEPQFINIKAQHASAGLQHTYIWQNNEVYCWGSNQDYKLGFEHQKQYPLSKSQIFSQAIQSDLKLQKIVCGDSHSLAVFKLEEDENVQSYSIFAWGESKSYQLALQTQGVVNQPIMIDFNMTVKEIYSRSDYNFLINQQGQCYSWGTNIFSRLGFLNSIKNQKFPTLVKQLPKIKQISMGKYHCFAITQQNEAYSWGLAMQGQLGISNLNQNRSQNTPTKVYCEQKIVQVACGQFHTLVLTQNNNLMSCGSNANFALGHQQVDQKKRCKKLTKINNTQKIRVYKIACGYKHNLILSSDKKVYSWGCNKYGQLGRGQITNNQVQIRRELYKQQIYRKKHQQNENKVNEKSSPFLQLKQTKQLISSQLKLCQNQYDSNQSLKHQLYDWKRRYEQFKARKQKQQKQFMSELQQILRGSK